LTDAYFGSRFPAPLSASLRASSFVRQAVAALNGEETTPVIQTDFVIVTNDNLEDPDVNRYLYKSACG
jgi:ribose transport system substrate-binding protein